MQMTDEQIYQNDARDYLPVFARYKIVLDHGDGVYVYDSQGRKYIDFLGGIAVNVLGHNHPALVKAVAEQAGKLIHCSNLYYTEVQARAAEKLVKLSGLGKVFFANSGAEANEGAIKIARKYPHTISPDKSQIITALHSFHGRTIATLTATGQPKYQEGFGPLPAGFDYVEYNNIEALESMMSEKTAAVMLEPIQGEGGVHVPEEAYLKKVRELCDKYDALLLFDEIQSGMGRSGCFFAYEAFGVKPDVVTLAKGLAGGVPIGAFISSDKVAEAFKPGDHGSTFGGNPLACAAVYATLATIKSEGLVEKVAQKGEYFMGELKKLQAKYPDKVKEVRGRGLILGMELTSEARPVVEHCLANRVIVNCTAGSVIRIVPPLIISKEEIDMVVAALDKALAAM